jgi:pimeloyl-ACP methyl ester carboxylesterase
MVMSKFARVLGGLCVAVVAVSIAGVALWPSGSPASGHGVAGSAQVGFVPAPMSWHTCPSETLATGTFPGTCATLEVPLDYAHPEGAKVELAVSKIEHTSSAADYQGVMLVNPGGPGIAGMPIAQSGKYVPHKVGASYDWIGFDPRGVGLSRPRLSCDGKYFSYARPPYRTTTGAQQSVWLQRSQDYAAACGKNGRALLDHVKTVDTVKDMDSLRRAVGAEQINYFGWSYGTYLGQVYSTLYPARVRRMVLDGVMDPSRTTYQSQLDQDLGFEQTMKMYFAWIAKYDGVYHLGRTEAKVETRFYAVRDQLDRHPAGGKIGGDEWTDAFIWAGYRASAWEALTKAFSDYAIKGDGKLIKKLVDGVNPQGIGYDNNYAMYLATECTDDTSWPADWSTWIKDNQAIYPKARFNTWINLWFDAPCHYWPAKPGQAVTVDGAKAPGILLISETYDAATPFSGALETRRRYPKASLVEGVGGSSHAASLSGATCIDDTIADYLATGALPKRLPGNVSDKKCAPYAQPDPS